METRYEWFASSEEMKYVQRFCRGRSRPKLHFKRVKLHIEIYTLEIYSNVKVCKEVFINDTQALVESLWSSALYPYKSIVSWFLG